MIQTRTKGRSKGVIEGRAAPFHQWTSIGGDGRSYLERMTPATFRATVTRGGGKNAPLLRLHDYGQLPIGKPLEWSIEDDGLYCRWQLDLKSKDGAEAFRQASEGFVTGLSVGFLAGPEDRIEERGEVLRVTRGPAVLREVSLVAVGAYEDASILDTRSARRAQPATREQLTAAEAITRLNQRQSQELDDRIRLARFGPENRRALEATSLDRIRSDYPGLLYPDDKLSLNGDGSFTPVGEKRSIVANHPGD